MECSGLIRWVSVCHSCKSKGVVEERKEATQQPATMILRNYVGKNIMDQIFLYPCELKIAALWHQGKE